MLSGIKKIQIFIIFFLSVITCDLKAWDFFVYHTSDVLPEISVKSIKPFDLYESKIKTFFFKTQEMPCSFYSGKISVSYSKLKQVSGIDNRVYIFVVPGEFSGKGGQLKKADGEIVRYVFVRENCSAAEFCHELCHAIAGLGDEYGGNSAAYPENMRKAKGKTVYPNLTWYENDFNEWKDIVDTKKYFSGGVGYDNGIFHAYENCLMKDLSQPLCPICCFYLQKALEKY